MTPFAGTLLQILRGFMLIFWVVMLGLTVFTPDQVDGNLAWTTAVVVAVYTVTFGWRLLTAQLGMNRCYLLAEGVAVTNRFRRVTDSVAWSDVTGVQQTTVVELYMGAHRLEIHRNQSAKPLTFLAPGVKSRLVERCSPRAAAQEPCSEGRRDLRPKPDVPDESANARTQATRSSSPPSRPPSPTPNRRRRSSNRPAHRRRQQFLRTPQTLKSNRHQVILERAPSRHRVPGMSGPRSRRCRAATGSGRSGRLATSS